MFTFCFLFAWRQLAPRGEKTPSPRGVKQQGQVDGRQREAGVRVSSDDWFEAGVARQRVDPIALGIAPRVYDSK